MDKKEFLWKIYNETQPRREEKLDFIAIWELIRQGEFIIEGEKTRFKFYDTFYTRLNHGEKFDDEKIASLSYEIRKEFGEI